MPNETDPIAEAEAKALKMTGLSPADVALYRRWFRTEPNPSCPRAMTAAELRKKADEVDGLEKLFKGEQNHG